MLTPPIRSAAELLAITGFSALVLFHVWLRLYAKARKARLRPRGKVHTVSLLDQIVGWYLGFWALAVVEWGLGIWSFHWSVAFLGATIYGVSGFLQWKAFHDLGNAYSPDIEVQEEQPLVRTGLYGIVRHPLIASLVLELLGVTLFFNSYIAMAAAAVGFVRVVKRRMREEEMFLLENLGERYRLYCQEVGALWPRSLRKPDAC